jgi:hypothetical protein
MTELPDFTTGRPRQVFLARAGMLWMGGHDTKAIAERLGVPEEDVYNRLGPIKAWVKDYRS